MVASELSLDVKDAPCCSSPLSDCSLSKKVQLRLKNVVSLLKYQIEPLPFKISNYRTVAGFHRDDVWYTLHRLLEPEYTQSADLTLNGVDDGSIRLSAHAPDITDFGGTPEFLARLLTTPHAGPSGPQDSVIHVDEWYLLIPSIVHATAGTTAQQWQRGTSHYLLMERDLIDLPTAKDSPAAATPRWDDPESFLEATSRHLDRQPLNLWENDHMDELRGKPTKHFLKSFGRVYNHPTRSKDSVHFISDHPLSFEVQINSSTFGPTGAGLLHLTVTRNDTLTTLLNDLLALSRTTSLTLIWTSLKETLQSCASFFLCLCDRVFNSIQRARLEPQDEDVGTVVEWLKEAWEKICNVDLKACLETMMGNLRESSSFKESWQSVTSLFLRLHERVSTSIFPALWDRLEPWGAGMIVEWLGEVWEKICNVDLVTKLEMATKDFREFWSNLDPVAHLQMVTGSLKGFWSSVDLMAYLEMIMELGTREFWSKLILRGLYKLDLHFPNDLIVHPTATDLPNILRTILHFLARLPIIIKDPFAISGSTWGDLNPMTHVFLWEGYFLSSVSGSETYLDGLWQIWEAHSFPFNLSIQSKLDYLQHLWEDFASNLGIPIVWDDISPMWEGHRSSSDMLMPRTTLDELLHLWERFHLLSRLHRSLTELYSLLASCILNCINSLQEVLQSSLVTFASSVHLGVDDAVLRIRTAVAEAWAESVIHVYTIYELGRSNLLLRDWPLLEGISYWGDNMVTKVASCCDDLNQIASETSRGFVLVAVIVWGGFHLTAVAIYWLLLRERELNNERGDDQPDTYALDDEIIKISSFEAYSETFTEDEDDCTPSCDEFIDIADSWVIFTHREIDESVLLGMKQTADQLQGRIEGMMESLEETYEYLNSDDESIEAEVDVFMNSVLETSHGLLAFIEKEITAATASENTAEPPQTGTGDDERMVQCKMTYGPIHHHNESANIPTTFEDALMEFEKTSESMKTEIDCTPTICVAVSDNSNNAVPTKRVIKSRVTYANEDTEAMRGLRQLWVQLSERVHQGFSVDPEEFGLTAQDYTFIRRSTWQPSGEIPPLITTPQIDYHRCKRLTSSDLEAHQERIAKTWSIRNSKRLIFRGLLSLVPVPLFPRIGELREESDPLRPFGGIAWLSYYGYGISYNIHKGHVIHYRDEEAMWHIRHLFDKIGE